MRARLSSDRWRVVIPFLDQALEMEESRRGPWLASVRGLDATLADDLELLLERHQLLEDRGFLRNSPLPPPPRRASLAGQVFGSYRLVSAIGQGGMGSVWLAERCDGQYKGTAAVKLLSTAFMGPGGDARFRREGSILARLRHPHIAQLIDAGVSPQGQPYLVLERVDGQRIDRYCDERVLGVEERIRLFLDVLGAVSHAHAKLVVHRDIKPSNVMVGVDGQVKLLDFGIAKLIETDEGDTVTALTGEGESILTPEYAAPEQLMHTDVTTATDVYALGVVLYVLLTGRHPAGDETSSPARLVRATLETEPPPASEAVAESGAEAAVVAARRGSTPRKLRSALRGDLDNVIAMALKKEPAARYASAEAMADDLRRYLAHEPVSARPDSLGYRAGRFLRRHRLGAGAALLLVLSLATGLGATAWQSARATREAARAQAVTEFLVSLFELSSTRRPQSEKVTARELLDQGVKRLDTDLADQPAMRASLLGVIGRVYASLGLYDSAAPVLERSLVLLRAQGDEDDPERARVLAELADVRRGQGDYPRAIGEARDALDLQRRLHRGDHPEVADALQLLASSHLDQAQPAEAEPLLQEALAMRRRVHGDAHKDVVQSLGRLGDLALDRSDYERAEALYREALGIARRLPGDSFPSVPESLARLGAVLQQRGKAAEAVGLHREALRLLRARLGDQHPDLTQFIRNLAAALRHQGEVREATDLVEQSLALERSTLGGEHHEVAKTTFDLATLLHEQGRLEEAEVRYQECLAILTKLLPPGHPHMGRALAGLARVRLDRGHPGEAEALFRRSLRILEQGLPPGHDLTAGAKAGIGRALLAQGRRLEEAQGLLEQAAGAYRAKFGATHSLTAAAELSLGECLLARGLTSEARRRARESLPTLRHAYGEEDPRTRRARQIAASLTLPR